MPAMLRTPRRHEEILTHRTNRSTTATAADIESDSCFDVQDDTKKNLHDGFHFSTNTNGGSPSSSSPVSGGGVSSGRLSPSTTIPQRKRRRRRKGGTAWKTGALAMGVMLVLLTVVGLFLDIESSPQQPHMVMRKMTESPPRFQKYSLDAPTACNQELSADDVSYTLVTQVSSDRLWMMEHQCQRWRLHNETHFPISIAVLTNDTTSHVQQQLRDMGCDLDHVVTVATLLAKLFPYDDYPVNILRNLALKAVKTSHVLYIDIDFWMNRDLSQILLLPDVTEKLASDPKATLVIPAFMLLRQCKQWKECPEQNIPQMPMTLDGLKKQILSHAVTRFDPTNRGGHGSTKYKEWFKQNYPDGDALVEIDCFLSNRYEPYLVFRYCQELPPFQDQFSGYGKNKMTWVMQLRRMGYTFWQLGKGAFVIHYPHLDSPSRVAWNDAPRKLKDPSMDQWLVYKRGRMDQLFVEFREWLRNEVPDETKTPFCADKLDDDANLRYDREKFRNQTASQKRLS